MRVTDDDGALAEIIADERRKDEQVPREENGLASEVREIRIERFDARHGEHDRAENKEAEDAVVRDETSGVAGIQSPQDDRLVHD